MRRIFEAIDLDQAWGTEVAARGVKVRDDERGSPVLERDGSLTRDLELLSRDLLVGRVLR